MLVMAVVMHQTGLWMVVLTAFVSAVKLVPRSKRLSGPIALGLGAFAVIFLILYVLPGDPPGDHAGSVRGWW